jgi:hypothetical protein
VGLSRFHETARSYLARDERAAAEARALIGARSELAGRVSARRAQIAALRARGAALACDLENRAQHAETLLRRVPCPLDEARAAVDAVEAGLMQATRV